MNSDENQQMLDEQEEQESMVIKPGVLTHAANKTTTDYCVVNTQSHAEFAKEVWETLSAINVNEHTEQKGGFTYLSWNWAWNTLMSKYPASSYEFLPDVVSDEGVMVFCKLTVSNGENSIDREMWLPVLDFKNKAIKNPNAMDVNSARMRCLVKSMAMAGLGNYIYSGQTEPPEQDVVDKNLMEFTEHFDSQNGYELLIMQLSMDQEDFGKLVGSIQSDPISKDNPRGNKTKKHEALWNIIDRTREDLIEEALLIKKYAEEDDNESMRELVEELVDSPACIKKFIWSQLNDFEKEAFNNNKPGEK